MARVTVEDCIDKVSNRFELTLIAAQRAKNIAIGAPITVERDNDKNPVVALREIADETIDKEAIKANLVANMQKVKQIADPVVEEKEIAEALAELSLDNNEYAYIAEKEEDIAKLGAFEVGEVDEE